MKPRHGLVSYVVLLVYLIVVIRGKSLHENSRRRGRKLQEHHLNHTKHSTHHGEHTVHHPSYLHQYIHVAPLSDRISCNTNPSDNYVADNYHCYDEFHQPQPCEKKKTEAKQCEFIQLRLLSEFSKPLHEGLISHLLMELFQKSDINKVFRRIVIEFLKGSHSLVS
jgi:hypothetical protein